MSPCLFEALICLKCNKEWWNLDLVKEMWEGVHDGELKEMQKYHDYDEDSNDDDEKME